MAADKVQEQVSLLVEIVSRQAGQLQMLEAAVVGIMDEACRAPALSGAIVARIEQAYAKSLGDNANAEQQQMLEAMREKLLFVAEAAAIGAGYVQ
ncbi:MAG TPA: hypothetical protein VIN03_13805 [Roseateles sp.]